MVAFAGPKPPFWLSTIATAAIILCLLQTIVPYCFSCLDNNHLLPDVWRLKLLAVIAIVCRHWILNWEQTDLCPLSNATAGSNISPLKLSLIKGLRDKDLSDTNLQTFGTLSENFPPSTGAPVFYVKNWWCCLWHKVASEQDLETFLRPSYPRNPSLWKSLSALVQLRSEMPFRHLSRINCLSFVENTIETDGSWWLDGRASRRSERNSACNVWCTDRGEWRMGE